MGWNSDDSASVNFTIMLVFTGLIQLFVAVCLLEYRVAVTIKLLDVNDETPVFTMQPVPYRATASEQANSKVDYRITVSDGDASSSLTFTLLEGNGLTAC